jgi:hypothetical protein
MAGKMEKNEVMNVLLWVLQFIMAFYFLFTGVVHFVLPPGLPAHRRPA